jgi:hypothetical protein
MNNTNTPPPGYAIFLGKNGYDHEREEALKILIVGQAYKVKEIHIGQSSTKYYLEDVPSFFNSVMFACDQSTVPVNWNYSTRYYHE